MKTGIEFIAEERQRQIDVEGWNAEHDDIGNNDEQLAEAAALYALPEIRRTYEYDVNNLWPWDKKWWKPTPDDRIKELAKAGALIAAEIDRLQRIQHSKIKRTESWQEYMWAMFHALAAVRQAVRASVRQGTVFVSNVWTN